MKLPTFSQAKIALTGGCLFPWTTQKEWPPQPETARMKLGTEVHQMAQEAAIMHGRVPEDVVHSKEALEYKAAIERFFAEWVFRREGFDWPEGRGGWTDLRIEKAIGIDPIQGSCRELKSSGHRDYSDAKDGEVCGTPDLVLMQRTVEREATLVVDFKTGDHANNDQLLLGCLGYRYVYPRAKREAMTVHLKPDGTYYTTVLEVTDEALDELEWQLCDMLGRAAAGPAKAVSGDHCRFCPVASECPEVVTALGLRPTALIRSPEHAAELLKKLTPAKRALEVVENALREYARTTPIVSGDKVWGPADKTRRSCSPTTTLALELEKRGLQVKHSVSITELEKKAPDMVAHLERVGCLTTSTYEEFRETKNGKR